MLCFLGTAFLKTAQDHRQVTGNTSKRHTIVYRPRPFRVTVVKPRRSSAGISKVPVRVRAACLIGLRFQHEAAEDDARARVRTLAPSRDVGGPPGTPSRGRGLGRRPARLQSLSSSWVTFTPPAGRGRTSVKSRVPWLRAAGHGEVTEGAAPWCPRRGRWLSRRATDVGVAGSLV